MASLLSGFRFPSARPLIFVLTRSLIVALLCAAEVLSMTGFSTYPALLAQLRDGWQLTNSQAGLIGGAYFAGYMAAVPLLSGLTDKIDARRIYLVSTLLSAAGALSFALFARNLGSALVCQAIGGAGLAGTYMPGLKILSEHIGGSHQSRAVAFYTSSFGIGGSVSLLLAERVASAAGWEQAFAMAAIGPLAAGFLVYRGLPARTPAGRALALDLRPVFKNRGAIRYIFGYAAHCWELFGLRSWMVAFFAFSFSLHAQLPPWSPATLAAAINLLGPAASIFGNELAIRGERVRVIVTIMTSSSLLACLIGFAAPLPWWLLFTVMSLHFIAVMGDSAALTAGVVAEAARELRGATMAVHSLLGFGAGFLAPLVFGIVLDASGGNKSVLAWGFAFASLGAGIALAWPLLRRAFGAGSKCE